MDKPEFLTGEAKSLEGYFVEMINKEPGLENSQRFLDTGRFLIQPFTPSLITELFEGWEQKITRIGETVLEPTQGYVSYDIFNGKQLENGEFCGIRFHHTQYEDGDYFLACDNCSGLDVPRSIEKFTQVVPPETLNDFIRDCKRSGITLQWKNP